LAKFELKTPQIKFVGSAEQFPAYVGGVGTGKSTSLISKALFHSQESPDNLGVIVRRQFTDLRNSTIKDFESYTGLKVNESTHECKLPNGSVILFVHGDVLDTLKNINCGWFGMEQAEEFPDDTAFQFLKMRLRRKVAFRTGFVIANANGHNWIWRIWKKDGAPKNHELIEATTLDFADIHAPDYIENLKTLPDKLYRRYVLNSWEEAEGLVYDEWQESLHVIEPIDIPDTWEHGFVLDHGFRNPTAVMFYAIDFDGNVYIYDEHYEREKPLSYHSDIIKGKTKVSTGYADPSIFNKTQAKGNYIFSIADEYNEFGITLIPSLREEETARIARGNEFLKSCRVKVFRTCSNFIHEIGNWKWEAPKSGNTLNLKERPQDKDNHLMDCFGYLLCSRFNASVEKKPGTPTGTPQSYLDKVVAQNAKGIHGQHRFDGDRKRS